MGAGTKGGPLMIQSSTTVVHNSLSLAGFSFGSEWLQQATQILASLLYGTQ